MLVLGVVIASFLVHLRGGAAQPSEDLLVHRIECPQQPCIIVAHSYPASSTAAFNQVDEGTDMAMGYRFWVNRTNENGFMRGSETWRIELRQYNDENNATNVGTIYTALAEWAVDNLVLVGPYASTYTRAALEAINNSTNNTRPLIYGHAAGEDLWDPQKIATNQFSIMTLTEHFADTVLSDLTNNDYYARTVSVLHRINNPSFTEQIYSGLQDSIARLNLVSTGDEPYVRGEEVDLSEKVRALHANNPNPDMFFAIGFRSHAREFVRAANSVGYRPKAFIITSGAADPSLVDEMDANSSWLIGTTQWHPSLRYQDDFWGTAQQFSDDYAAWIESDVEASHDVAGAAAVGSVIVQALGQINSSSSFTDMQLADALRGVDTELFYGAVNLTTGGQNMAKPMYMTQVFVDEPPAGLADAQIEYNIEVVAPDEHQFREVRYPKPGSEPDFEIVEPCPTGEMCIRVGFSWPADFDTAQHQEGSEMRLGYKYWARKTNEAGGFDIAGLTPTRRHVELVAFNDHNVNEDTRRLYSEMCSGTGAQNQNVDYVLGPYGTSKVTEALASVRECNWTLIFGHGAGENIFEGDYGRVFGVMTSAADYTESAVRLFEQSGATNAVALHLRGPDFTEDVYAGLLRHLDGESITLTANRSYTFAQLRQEGELDRLVGELAAADMYPDIFFGIGFLSHARSIVAAIDTSGIRPKAIFLTSAPSTPTWVADNLLIADHLIGPTQWHHSLRDRDDFYGNASAFSADFEDFDPDPVDLDATHNNAAGAAVGLVFQRALENAASNSQADLAAAASALDMQTFFGDVRFDIKGRNTAKQMITTQTFVDSEVAFINVIAPASEVVGINTFVYPIPGNEEPPPGPAPDSTPAPVTETTSTLTPNPDGTDEARDSASGLRTNTAIVLSLLAAFVLLESR